MRMRARPHRLTRPCSHAHQDGKGVDPALVHCLIIKAADISNPSRPLGVYQQWIGGVMQEFFTQGDAERAAGLPISMNCDRHKVHVPKCQVRMQALPMHSMRMRMPMLMSMRMFTRMLMRMRMLMLMLTHMLTCVCVC